MNKYAPEIATLRMDMEREVNDGADTTRRTTLCLLAQFLGFADWEMYLASLATRTDIESAAFEGEGVHIDDLKPGDRVEVTWLPNRRCVFRYEGDAHFLVLESENAKLHAGESFDAVDSYDAENEEERKNYSQCCTRYSEFVQSQWAVRDSLINLYEENDPLREQCRQYWVRQEAQMSTELLSLLSSKLK